MNIFAISNINPRVKMQSSKKSEITVTNHHQVNFRGIVKYNDEKINQIAESKKFILDSVSKIFEKDREIINEHFLGEVAEQDKFSKLGYYLTIKENDTVLNEYFQSKNLRQLSKEYSDFYNSNLKSYPNFCLTMFILGLVGVLYLKYLSKLQL